MLSLSPSPILLVDEAGRPPLGEAPPSELPPPPLEARPDDGKVARVHHHHHPRPAGAPRAPGRRRRLRVLAAHDEARPRRRRPPRPVHRPPDGHGPLRLGRRRLGVVPLADDKLVPRRRRLLPRPVVEPARGPVVHHAAKVGAGARVGQAGVGAVVGGAGQVDPAVVVRVALAADAASLGAADGARRAGAPRLRGRVGHEAVEATAAGPAVLWCAVGCRRLVVLKLANLAFPAKREFAFNDSF